MLYCPKKFRRPCIMKSDHSLALGSTQPLTEISIRNISWGVKAAGV